VAVSGDNRAFAATWRVESTGEVARSTWGGTVCWFPRIPQRFRARRGDFEHVLRCRDCPGCLEFERRRLADRLSAKYQRMHQLDTNKAHRPSAMTSDKKYDGNLALHVVRIWAPLSRQARLSHQLHRCPTMMLEPGFFRLGAGSFAVLSSAPKRLQGALRRMGIRFQAEPLLLRRGRRAWRPLTAGLLVSREVYGEQLKRWYVRGLPAAEKESFEIEKTPQYEVYHRATSPRAWSGGRLILVPPEVWSWSRVDRRKLRQTLARQPNPEGVRMVMHLVHDVAQKRQAAIPVIAPRGARPDREAQLRLLAKMAERQRAGTDLPDASGSQRPSSEAGGYASSGHSGNAPPAHESWREADRRRAEERRTRTRKEIEETLERLRVKIEQREKDHDK
jgi:hypothetical protein